MKALIALITDRRARAYRFALVALTAIVATMVTAVCKTGCSHQADMGWDPILMLDGATRLLQGQMPHSDYVAVIGIFPIAVIALGLVMSDGAADALAFGPAALVGPLTAYAWWVARRRLPAFPALAFCLLVCALILATRPLPWGLLPYTFEFSHTSYAMFYNRVGWALLSVFMLQRFLPPAQVGVGWRSNAEYFVSGVLAVALVLTKVNYAAAAVGVIVVSWFIWRETPSQRLAFAAGIVAVCVSLTFFTRFSFVAWSAETRLLGNVNDLGARLVNVRDLTVTQLGAIIVIVVSFFLVRSLFRLDTDPRCRWPRVAPAALLVCCIGCGLVVTALNMQNGEIPLFFVGCLIMGELAVRGIGRESTVTSETSCLRFGSMMGVALFLGAQTIVNDAASVVWSAGYSNHARARVPPENALHSVPLRNFTLPPQRYEQAEKKRATALLLKQDMPQTPYQYSLILNDGVKLLAPTINRESRIFTFDLFNPFPYALKLNYPKGGILWWAPNTFSENFHPEPHRLFEGVTHVMIAKLPIRGSSDHALMQRVYQPILKERFTVAGESEFWILLSVR